jgi:hypothetical protein
MVQFVPQKLETSWSGSERGGDCELISSSSLKLGSDLHGGEEVLLFWRSAGQLDWQRHEKVNSSSSTYCLLRALGAVAGGWCMLLFGYSFAPSLPPERDNSFLSTGSDKAQAEAIMAAEGGAEKVT